MQLTQNNMQMLKFKRADDKTADVKMDIDGNIIEEEIIVDDNTFVLVNALIYLAEAIKDKII